MSSRGGAEVESGEGVAVLRFRRCEMVEVEILRPASALCPCLLTESLGRGGVVLARASTSSSKQPR